MRQRADYEIRSVTRLVRSEHVAGAWNGMVVGTLVAALSKMPKIARLSDIEYDDDSDDIKLVFCVESEHDENN